MPNPILALESRVKPLILPDVHSCPLHTNSVFAMERHGGKTVGMGAEQYSQGVSVTVVPSCAKCYLLFKKVATENKYNIRTYIK